VRKKAKGKTRGWAVMLFLIFFIYVLQVEGLDGVRISGSRKEQRCLLFASEAWPRARVKQWSMAAFEQQAYVKECV